MSMSKVRILTIREIAQDHAEEEETCKIILECLNEIERLKEKATILRDGLRAIVGASDMLELEALRAITEPMVAENENAKAGICGIVALLKASDI